MQEKLYQSSFIIIYFVSWLVIYTKTNNSNSTNSRDRIFFQSFKQFRGRRDLGKVRAVQIIVNLPYELCEVTLDKFKWIS